MENKIKETTETKTVLTLECDLCKKIIKGSTKEQILYNMETHRRQKHTEEFKE